MDASTIQTLLNQGGLAIALVLLLLLLVGGWRAFTTRKVVFGWQYDLEREEHERDQATLARLAAIIETVGESGGQRHHDLELANQSRHREIVSLLQAMARPRR